MFDINLQTVRIYTSALMLVTIVSCASNPERSGIQASTPDTNKSIDQRIAEEPAANTSEAIVKRAADVFTNAEGLTTNQKKELRIIYLQTYQDAIAIREEIGKAKSLLFKIVSTKGYSSADVEQIREKIVGLDSKRLAIMFKSLADVQKIVGIGVDKELIYKHFFDYEYPRYENLSQKK